MPVAYYVELPLSFPEGVHFGAGKHANTLTVSRDGQKRPILNGTSLAGILRTLWRRHLHPDGKSPKTDDDKTNPLFGRALGSSLEDSGEESCVKVSNYQLDLGDATVTDRTHHQRNRHRGTVLDDALFSVEQCPPGTTVLAGFWIREQSNVPQDDIDQFLRVVSAGFQNGLRLGGSSNRGFGRAELTGDVVVRLFDLTNLHEHVEFLTAHRQWRSALKTPGTTVTGGKPRSWEDSPADPKPSDFCMTLTLGIPRGQDLLVGDGQADEVQIEPQRVQSADGKWYWRIPGASIRGMLRGWFHRLAAMDGHGGDLADQASAFRERENNTYKPDKIAQGFGQYRECPVTKLFGNIHLPGRLRISDALSRCSSDEITNCAECQDRIHVAVDRITGGTAPGMLFKNRVLTNSSSESPRFEFDLKIDNPVELELDWLARSLVALHRGILHVGSSKSSGRLEVVACQVADSDESQKFVETIRPHFPVSVRNQLKGSQS